MRVESKLDEAVEAMDGLLRGALDLDVIREALRPFFPGAEVESELKELRTWAELVTKDLASVVDVVDLIKRGLSDLASDRQPAPSVEVEVDLDQRIDELLEQAKRVAYTESLVSREDRPRLAELIRPLLESLAAELQPAGVSDETIDAILCHQGPESLETILRLNLQPKPPPQERLRTAGERLDDIEDRLRDLEFPVDDSA